MTAVAAPRGPIWEGGQSGEREGNGPSLSTDPMLRRDTENNAIHLKNGQRYTGTSKQKDNQGHDLKIKVNFFFLS